MHAPQILFCVAFRVLFAFGVFSAMVVLTFLIQHLTRHNHIHIKKNIKTQSLHAHGLPGSGYPNVYGRAQYALCPHAPFRHVSSRVRANTALINQLSVGIRTSPQVRKRMSETRSGADVLGTASDFRWQSRVRISLAGLERLRRHQGRYRSTGGRCCSRLDRSGTEGGGVAAAHSRSVCGGPIACHWLD